MGLYLLNCKRCTWKACSRGMSLRSKPLMGLALFFLVLVMLLKTLCLLQVLYEFMLFLMLGDRVIMLLLML